MLNSLAISTKESVCIDIGANIGNHSLYFSDFYRKVYSFEPSEKIFNVLSLNSKLVNNIQCFNFGCSNEDKTALLSSVSTNRGGSFISSEEKEGETPNKKKAEDARQGERRTKRRRIARGLEEDADKKKKKKKRRTPTPTPKEKKRGRGRPPGAKNRAKKGGEEQGEEQGEEEGGEARGEKNRAKKGESK